MIGLQHGAESDSDERRHASPTPPSKAKKSQRRDAKDAKDAKECKINSGMVQTGTVGMHGQYFSVIHDADFLLPVSFATFLAFPLRPLRQRI
jgi:hypothetical protein